MKYYDIYLNSAVHSTSKGLFRYGLLISTLMITSSCSDSDESTTEAQAGVIYVDQTAQGNRDGTSWSDAYISLQDAFETAQTGDQIWIAAGIYYPDERAGVQSGDREDSFILPDGVKVYGGFSGTETRLPTIDGFDQIEKTILSGDIDKNDTNKSGISSVASIPQDTITSGNNSNNVVDITYAGSESALERVYITGGIAQDSTRDTEASGGGIYAHRGTSESIGIPESPSLNYLWIEGNYSAGRGGGISIFMKDFSLKNSTVTRNVAGDNGGGVFYYGSSISDYKFDITNTSISYNTVGNFGGNLTIFANQPVISDSEIVGGMASGENSTGGGIYSESRGTTTGLTMTNTLIANNYADAGGGMRVSASETVDLNNVTFENNAAKEGGAYYAYSTFSARHTFTSCNFAQNQTSSKGGAIYSWNTAMDMTDTNFLSNLAPSGASFYGDVAQLCSPLCGDITNNVTSGKFYELDGSHGIYTSPEIYWEFEETVVGDEVLSGEYQFTEQE